MRGGGVISGVTRVLKGVQDTVVTSDMLLLVLRPTGAGPKIIIYCLPPPPPQP